MDKNQKKNRFDDDTLETIEKIAEDKGIPFNKALNLYIRYKGEIPEKERKLSKKSFPIDRVTKFEYKDGLELKNRYPKLTLLTAWLEYLPDELKTIIYENFPDESLEIKNKRLSYLMISQAPEIEQLFLRPKNEWHLNPNLTFTDIEKKINFCNGLLIPELQPPDEHLAFFKEPAAQHEVYYWLKHHDYKVRQDVTKYDMLPVKYFDYAYKIYISKAPTEINIPKN